MSNLNHNSTSTSNRTWLSDVERSSSNIYIIPIQKPSNISTPKIDENYLVKLTFLENSLGFNVSEFAKILKISRQTYYNWKKDDTSSQKPKPRLDTIYDIFKAIDEPYLHEIVKYAKRRIDKNTTLFGMLCMQDLDKQRINATISEIKLIIERNNRRQKIREERIKEGMEGQDKPQPVIETLTRKVSSQ